MRLGESFQPVYYTPLAPPMRTLPTNFVVLRLRLAKALKVACMSRRTGSQLLARVDVRWICARTCADIAMSVRVDIVRISYGYADIARISHGYSTTRRHAAGEITRRALSCYSYVCHYPLSESQPPKPVPSFAGLCPALGDALCKHARNTTTTTHRRTHAPRTDVCSGPPRWPRPAQAPPFEHQSS